MKLRNNKTHRQTQLNERKTRERVEQYYGKVALLSTWEAMPDQVQIKHHEYIVKLRADLRQIRSYIMHRADPSAEI